MANKQSEEIAQLLRVVKSQQEDNKQLLGAVDSLKEQVAQVIAEKSITKRGKSALKEARKAPLEVIGMDALGQNGAKVEAIIRDTYENPVKSKDASKNKIRAGYVNIKSFAVLSAKPTPMGHLRCDVKKTLFDGTSKEHNFTFFIGGKQ